MGVQSISFTNDVFIAVVLKLHFLIIPKTTKNRELHSNLVDIDGFHLNVLIFEHNNSFIKLFYQIFIIVFINMTLFQIFFQLCLLGINQFIGGASCLNTFYHIGKSLIQI